MRQILQHIGQRGDIDPTTVIRILRIAEVYTEGTIGPALDLLAQQPTASVTPEYETIVTVIGGIVVEGIAHHTIHHNGVRGTLLSVAARNTHIAETHAISHHTVLDAGQPRL